jgi:uncharacterized protein
MPDRVNSSGAAHGRRGVLRALGGGALLAVPSLAVAPASAEATGRRSDPRERYLRRRTLAAFERQAAGGTFYDVLADDVTWTVAAAEPSVHHGKQAFLVNGSGPVLDRLSTPLIPDVRAIWVQDDTVVVHWDGSAVARDGLPYRNSYCWIWSYRGDYVTRAVAFLDLVALNDLFERVPLSS